MILLSRLWLIMCPASESELLTLWRIASPGGGLYVRFVLVRGCRSSGSVTISEGCLIQYGLIAGVGVRKKKCSVFEVAVLWGSWLLCTTIHVGPYTCFLSKVWIFFTAWIQYHIYRSTEPKQRTCMYSPIYDLELNFCEEKDFEGQVVFRWSCCHFQVVFGREQHKCEG